MEEVVFPEEEINFITILTRSIKKLEGRLGLKLFTRGNKIFLEGEGEKLNFAKDYFNQIKELLERGYQIKDEDLQIALDLMEEDRYTNLSEFFSNGLLVSSIRKIATPKSLNQQRYIQAIKEFDIVFAIGPAGTGKTYLAMACALSSLQNKEVERIILTRPAVEAGEKLGFLPGDMYQKVNPYLRPLYDALFDLTHADKATRLIERGIIEIAPLAYMRGRTLNDSFIILDEAQNTTGDQMKMFLTRIGFNSKAVITGDITQIDIPNPKLSGMLEAVRLLSHIKGIAFIYFNEKDIVRHPLVMEIIKAYEEDSKKKGKK